MSARRFLFLLASSRAGGNTETLARYAADSLPPSVPVRWLALRDVPLPEFTDLRHGDADGHRPPVAGNERLLLDATLDATDIVLASPLYWYSVSTLAKRYLDHWSGWMRLPEERFVARMAGKTLWGVTVLAERDPAQADPLAGMLRRSAGFLDMRWGGLLLGNGSRPGDVLNDHDALDRARSFFAPVPVG